MLATVLASVLALSVPTPASAWGDEGHEVIAIIADALLKPAVRRKVHALLAADEDPLTDHDIASEATWADRYRDANPEGGRNRTSRWHFADIELAEPSLNQACFGRPQLPDGTMASDGPSHDCIIDKIDEFTTELGRVGTPPDERLIALKFLLHFVGDVHQPLHSSDDDDRGGNEKRVSVAGFRNNNLHHFWDTEFVAQLGSDPDEIAASLLRRTSAAQIQRWSAGTPADWARESFQLSARDAYGLLPPPSQRGIYHLSQHYVEVAVRDCGIQLSKAGVRLAALLNRTMN